MTIVQLSGRAERVDLVKFSATITGLDAFKKTLAKVQKQTRFATAVALTRTAQAIVKLEEREVAKTFDNPVPFTRKAFGYKRATPANLTATVFIKDKQAQYLLPSIHGGRRNAKKFELAFTADTNAPDVYWVPGPGIRLNASGNITKQQVLKLAVALKRSSKHGEVFAGIPRPGMPYGIYSRGKNGQGRSIVPLLIQVQRKPQYRKLFDFFGVGYKAVDREFQKHFKTAFDQAMRSAR